MPAKSQFEARFTLNMNPRFGDQVAGAVKRGIDKGMQAIVRTAARMSPYRTGHNARMISYVTSWGSGSGPLRNETSALGSAMQDTKHRAAVMTGSGYGGWLEIGTARIPARPYIRPAVEQEATFILRAIRDEIKTIS